MNVKSQARKIAVQGIYNILLLDKKPEDVGVFLDDLITSASAKEPIKLNRDYAKMLLDGVLFRQNDLDAMLEKHAKSKLHSPLVKAILLCGAFELMVMNEIASKTIIGEYINQAELYFDTPERPFIHAVLDSISKDVRA